MRIYIKTMGCKMNYADSESLASKLVRQGHRLVGLQHDPQVAIVNSCTVTHVADKKSLQVVKQLKKQFPRAKIVVTGCGAQLKENVYQDKRYINLIATKDEEILQFIEEESDPTHRDVGDVLCDERTRANIPIQTGCESMCSYCIIPTTRGRHVSYPYHEIIEMIREKEQEGYQEVVLTGINIGAWGGKNTLDEEGAKLYELMQSILEQTTIPRIRLGSVNPNYVDERFIEVFSNPRYCKQLHLSIQHASSPILKRMNRPYDHEVVNRVVEELYEAIPQLAITTDFIVGFPGESEEDFQELYSSVERWKIAKLHVFPYSPRKGTGAWHMKDHIPQETKKERVRMLIDLGNRLRQEYVQQCVGTVQEVLFERPKQEGIQEGWTDTYVRVRVEHPDSLFNTLQKVTIEAVEGEAGVDPTSPLLLGSISNI